MRWTPVVVQSERSDGSLVVTVGHPLVDAYLEFLRARARPNTIRAVAFDLKVFFSFVDKTPARVTSADVMAFITAQRIGDGGGKVVSIDRAAGLSPRTIRRRLSSVSGFYARYPTPSPPGGSRPERRRFLRVLPCHPGDEG